MICNLELAEWLAATEPAPAPALDFDTLLDWHRAYHAATCDMLGRGYRVFRYPGSASFFLRKGGRK